MIKLFIKNKNNVDVVLTILLKKLNVKISKTTIQDTLQNHPEYPSLLAVSDSLTEWHIENQSYQIAKTDYDPEDLLFPFIAHLKINSGVFIVVHEIVENKIIYSDETKHNAVMPEKDFLEKWSGAALHATANEKSGEPNFKSNIIKESLNAFKLPVLLIFIAGFVFYYLTQKNNGIGYSVLVFLKLVGIITSVLLLIQSLNASNSFIQNLCSLGKKNNCNAILKSDAAKITSWLSWSEVGFFYFTGTFLGLLFNSTYSLTIIAWLNVLALPYIVYSIGYQYKNKNWCVLCCTVQAILLLEFINTLITIPAIYTSSITLNIVLLTVFYLILPVLVWSVIKPYLIKAQETEPLRKQLKKFKYNSELFNQVLKSQPRYAVPDDLMPVILGNPEAETTITMVSNPFCAPCAKTHELLDNWLKHRDDIKLKIIFSTANHDDDQKTKVAKHVAALTLLKDTQLIENALNDWYKQNNKNYDVWAAKYPTNFNEEINDATQKQKTWCDIAEIAFTPTILVNGYKLPEPYRLADIKYLLT